MKSVPVGASFRQPAKGGAPLPSFSAELKTVPHLRQSVGQNGTKFGLKMTHTPEFFPDFSQISLIFRQSYEVELGGREL
jgi:hypothetical protein